MSLICRSKTALAALGVAACLVGVAAPAYAGDGDGAAGLIGGLAAGAIIGGAIASQHPGYYEPAYGYRHCWIARQRVYNQWGRFVGWRRVRECR
ncbi:MAG TPA: hypothetical protein VND97_06410 [Beijerinckiaceae bacterium]|nr:hypothetical protein [Beijerinckiaceae bacterium]